MKYSKNEGTIDRSLRAILAEVFFIVAFFWLSGILAIIFYTASFIMLATAATGLCPLYKLFGFNTNDEPNSTSSKMTILIFIILSIVIAVAGSYYSNFFTKKLFIEDYNQMNNYYKQTLFYTGQDKRPESLDNYNKLVAEYTIFNNKYQSYHPYAISKDKQFNADLTKVSNLIADLKEKINTGDLKLVHTELEQIRPIFQDILKRNGFSLLTVSLVDFHDAMEIIISKSDEKDSAGVIAVYGEVSEKLKAVENIENDPEIQTIRQKLDELLNLAQENQSDSMADKAAELKSAFVKVYLKRG